MAGLVPASTPFLPTMRESVDTRQKAGHDGGRWRRHALAVAVVSFIGVTSTHAQDTSPRPASELMDAVMWGKEPIGGPFTLVDTDGRSRNSEEFRGQLLLVYFGFTYCPDICPTDLQAMGLALDQLGEGGSAVQPLFITLDPERDTREHLGEYVKLFHPRLIGLTGERADVTKAADAYRVYYAKVPRDGDYTIDHSSFVYLMGRDGSFLGFFPPGTPPERMAAAIRPQLTAR
jgi:cytochrome oxidase Cu insertion factor (SCO1/SenC/PrrC family)